MLRKRSLFTLITLWSCALFASPASAAPPEYTVIDLGILPGSHSSAGLGISYYGLGECYRKIGKTVEAVRELETVMRLDPDYKESKLMLGQLYLRTGRAAEGGKLLHEYQEEQARTREYARISLLLASRPHDAAVHFEMARYYAASGKPERAVVELHRALEFNPQLADARKMLVGLEHMGQ